MEPRTARSNFIGALICGLSVVAFCLILLWRDPLVFWSDDYQISILPVFADVARSWSEWQWPILSPYSWVCGNLAGEYQYGTFSVFVNASVVVIWKLFSGFANQAAALSIVHLLALALGGFVLARGRNLSLALATMVGLIAALNGWIICWGASDWFGALGAFAWIPWAWWGCEKALHADATKARFLWPAPFVYLVATGGFPYTVLMLGLLIAWLTVKALVQSRSVWSPVPMLFGVALGFGLAAPALLALLAYVHGSAREAQPALAHWQWIVPPTALPGFILPNWTTNWADFRSRYLPHTGTELACGLVAPAAILAGLLRQGRSIMGRFGWEFALLLGVLVVAMLPTAGLFRWSFRWLPFVHLVMALCAAECLRSLGEDDKAAMNRFRILSPATVAILLVGVTGLFMALFHKTGATGFTLTWVLVALAISLAVVEFITEQRLAVGRTIHAWLPAAITFASLLATYLCIPPNCGVPRYNFTEALEKPDPLDRERLYLSIYSPAEVGYRVETRPQPVGQIVRPGSTSMWAQLRFVNGYSPIRPSGVAREFQAEIHGEIGFNVIERLLTQEAGANGLLAQLGVDGITLGRDYDFFATRLDAEWEMVTSAEEGRVFHRKGMPLARVRSVASLPSRPGQQFAAARISEIREWRNHVEAEVNVSPGDRPALITFSRPYFSGYKARLGPTKLKVASERGLFPVMEIPAGIHGRLVLTYRPAWLIYGGAVAVACAAVWLAGVILTALRPRS